MNIRQIINLIANLITEDLEDIHSYDYPSENTTKSWKQRIADFYILDLLNYTLEPKGPVRHPKEVIPAHSFLQEWVSTAYKTLVDNFSRDLYEALRFSIASELSHVFNINSLDYMAKRFPEIAENEQLFNSEASYSTRYTNLKEFESKTGVSIEEWGVRIFNNVNWRSGYGGKPWEDISKSTIDLKHSPSGELIDHIIDLEHNTGSVFNKNPWYNISITKLIELKAEKDPSFWAGVASPSVQGIFRVISRQFDKELGEVDDEPTKEKDPLPRLRSKSPAQRVYLVALNKIKGRWVGNEEIVQGMFRRMKDYPIDFVKVKCLEAEETIKKDPQWAYNYAKDVIGGRWPEAEEYIKRDAVSIYYYARFVIKGRWPEAEEIIKKYPIWAYHYANDVIGGRWPEAEEFIKKYPQCAYFYAKDVIKGRWPEAEEIIKKNPEMWRKYLRIIG